jgi:hypothetical protein
MSAENDPKVESQDPLDEDRRKFLAACGRFAAVTPPALTVLLSTSLNSEAVARSGGGRGGPPRGGRDRDLFEWLEWLFRKYF